MAPAPPYSAARALGAAGRVRQAVKGAVAWVALHSGLLALDRRRRGSDVILLYHRVRSGPGELPDYSPYGISVSAAAFEAQMGFLARHYDVVPLEAITGPAPSRRPRCAITFDDGWRDNLTAAWPVLRRFGFPATIFLATNLMEGGAWFWEERVMALAAHCHQVVHAGGAAAAAIRGCVRDPELAALLEGPEAALPASLAALVGRLRDDPARRDAVAGSLDAAVATPGCAPPRWFLSWDEVRTLAADGAAFGGHTASHVNLDRCPPEEAASEVARCEQALAYHLREHNPGGRPFAYPYGKHNAAVRRVVAGSGFSRACTTRRGPVRRGDDLYELARIDVYEDVAVSVPMFACRIASFLTLY